MDVRKEKTKWEKRKMAKSIANSIASKDGKPEGNSNKTAKTKTTKIEQKAYYDDCKRALSKTWKSMSDDSSDEAEVDVPSNFKSYTIQGQKYSALAA